MPPKADACLGGSLIPRTNCIPLSKWTSKSPARPVPYSFQQRQRANRYGSNGFFGAVPNQVSQSRFWGDRSAGGGYSQAPVGSLRPKLPSTRLSSPISPLSYRSFTSAPTTHPPPSPPT